MVWGDNGDNVRVGINPADVEQSIPEPGWTGDTTAPGATATAAEAAAAAAETAGGTDTAPK